MNSRDTDGLGGLYPLSLLLGSRGVILTDTAMFLLFSGIIVVVAFVVDAAGGWFHAIQSLATYTENLTSRRLAGLVPRCIGRRRSMACFGPLFWGRVGNRRRSQPVADSRYLMASNEHVVIRSACGALIACCCSTCHQFCGHYGQSD